MSRSFYFLSSFTQHIVDGAASASSHHSSFFSPNNPSVYQPLESQLILPDAAHCIAVRAYLRLADIPFNVVEIDNCHDASPSGTVPFIVADKETLAVAEWKPIITWGHMNYGVKNGGGQQQQQQQQQQQNDPLNADVAIWSDAIEKPVHLAELETTFVCEENYQQYAFPRIGSANSWPLSWAIPKRRRNKALEELEASVGSFGLSTSSGQSAVLDNFEKALTAAEIRLTRGKGDNWLASPVEVGPTEADCLLYGHLRAILDNKLPRDDIRDAVRAKPVLVQYCNRFADYLEQKADGRIKSTTERPASDHVVVGNGQLKTIAFNTDQPKGANH